MYLCISTCICTRTPKALPQGSVCSDSIYLGGHVVWEQPSEEASKEPGGKTPTVDGQNPALPIIRNIP